MSLRLGKGFCGLREVAAGFAHGGGAGAWRIKQLIFGYRISAWSCRYRLLSILPYRFTKKGSDRRSPIL
jgi:hypothetical protein